MCPFLVLIFLIYSQKNLENGSDMTKAFHPKMDGTLIKKRHSLRERNFIE